MPLSGGETFNLVRRHASITRGLKPDLDRARLGDIFGPTTCLDHERIETFPLSLSSVTLARVRRHASITRGLKPVAALDQEVIAAGVLTADPASAEGWLTG